MNPKPTHSLRLGDSLEVLKTLPDNSIDSVVTDPPYGLGKQPDAMAMLADWVSQGHHDVKGKGFMGKSWDAFVPQPALWKEVFRVLKPGGHILSFAGTRTYDLMTLSLRIAGFEIRDCVMWVYGSGFPKSLDVSKAIDKAAGAEREVVGRKTAGIANPDDRNRHTIGGSASVMVDITAPATPEAQQWAGWGTALKPAVEPCVLARKPLTGTVAENVLLHGTGALNVDGCRVEHTEECRMMAPSQANIESPSEKHRQAGRREAVLELKPAGRWPANLIHDGSDEVVGLFPEAGNGWKRNYGENDYLGKQYGGGVFGGGGYKGGSTYCDSGSAARFFYCPKTSSKERGEGNNHPTVKPIALMAYLCRLITPPGGTVLDPFMGSGSTGIASLQEGFNFIGIEREPEYLEIAKGRLDNNEDVLSKKDTLDA